MSRGFMSAASTSYGDSEFFTAKESTPESSTAVPEDLFVHRFEIIQTGCLFTNESKGLSVCLHIQVDDQDETALFRAESAWAILLSLIPQSAQCYFETPISVGKRGDVWQLSEQVISPRSDNTNTDVFVEIEVKSRFLIVLKQPETPTQQPPRVSNFSSLELVVDFDENMIMIDSKWLADVSGWLKRVSDSYSIVSTLAERPDCLSTFLRKVRSYSRSLGPHYPCFSPSCFLNEIGSVGHVCGVVHQSCLTRDFTRGEDQYRLSVEVLDPSSAFARRGLTFSIMLHGYLEQLPQLTLGHVIHIRGGRFTSQFRTKFIDVTPVGKTYTSASVWECGIPGNITEDSLIVQQIVAQEPVSKSLFWEERDKHCIPEAREDLESSTELGLVWKQAGSDPILHPIAIEHIQALQVWSVMRSSGIGDNKYLARNLFEFGNEWLVNRARLVARNLLQRVQEYSEPHQAVARYCKRVKQGLTETGGVESFVRKFQSEFETISQNSEYKDIRVTVEKLEDDEDLIVESSWSEQVARHIAASAVHLKNPEEMEEVTMNILGQCFLNRGFQAVRRRLYGVLGSDNSVLVTDEMPVPFKCAIFGLRNIDKMCGGIKAGDDILIRNVALRTNFYYRANKNEIIAHIELGSTKNQPIRVLKLTTW